MYSNSAIFVEDDYVQLSKREDYGESIEEGTEEGSFTGYPSVTNVGTFAFV